MEKRDILVVHCPICDSSTFHYKSKNNDIYDIAVCDSCGFEAEISHVEYSDTWTDHFFEYEGIEYSISIKKPLFPDDSTYVCRHAHTNTRNFVTYWPIKCNKCRMEFLNASDLESERLKAYHINNKMENEYRRELRSIHGPNIFF